jgi:hypothetical protein
MKNLNQLIENLAYSGMLAAWVFGLALAPGFWDVVGATFFPPYAWGLLAQALLKHWNLL